MRILVYIPAYLLGTASAYVFASGFYTQQVVAKQAAFGADYTLAQQGQVYWENFIGLAPAYGVVLAVALLLGFLVAAVVKRILTPLAPVAYPLAGAAAVFTAIWLIDHTIGEGGVGAIGGARDALGLGLQCLAGFIGGAVFASLRPRRAA